MVKLCTKIMTYNIKSGFENFYKLEPKMAVWLFAEIEKYLNNEKVSKILGINKDRFSQN